MAVGVGDPVLGNRHAGAVGKAIHLLVQNVLNKVLCEVLMGAVAVDDKAVRDGHGLGLEAPRGVGDGRNAVADRAVSALYLVPDVRHRAGCCQRKHEAPVLKACQVALVVIRLGVDGEVLVHLLIDLQALDELGVVELQGVRIVSRGTAHIHVGADKAVVVKDVRHVPLHDGGDALGGIIAVGEADHIEHRLRDRVRKALGEAVCHGLQVVRVVEKGRGLKA